jgi:hypothetical protein
LESQENPSPEKDLAYLEQNYPDLGQYNQALELIARCKEKIRQEEKQDEKREQQKIKS